MTARKTEAQTDAQTDAKTDAKTAREVAHNVARTRRGGRIAPRVFGLVALILVVGLVRGGRGVRFTAGGVAFAAGRAVADNTPAADRPIAPASDRAGDDTPAARAPEPPATASRAPAPPDLDKLRAEYDRIREELFKARVRSQKVADVAYPARLDLRLRWKGGPDFVIRKARFLLDGSELWDSADRAQTDDLIQVAERSVKPGPHALTVRLEVRPKTEAKGGAKTGADKLGYTSEHTFAIVVADSGLTHVLLTGDEDGDPPQYEPELELAIETDK